MTISVCEECGQQVKCSRCHPRCTNCGGLLKKVDYVKYVLSKQNDNNNKA